jgi:hypothetical protein
VFQISYFGIGPTEIRIGLLIYVATLLTVGPLPIVTRLGVFSLMDLVAMAIFPTVMVSFVVMTLREARRLGLQEDPAKITGITTPSAVHAGKVVPLMVKFHSPSDAAADSL